MNPLSVKPRRDWCLVLMDKREETISGGLLVLPVSETGSEKVTEGSGVVVRVGPGKKNEVLGLKAGDHVVYRSYLRFANALDTDELWDPLETRPKKKQYFLMSADDVLGVIPENVHVGVFSSPASHAVGAGAFDPKEGDTK